MSVRTAEAQDSLAVRAHSPVRGLDGIAIPATSSQSRTGRCPDVELARDEARLVSHILVFSGGVRGVMPDHATAQVRVRLEHEKRPHSHSSGGGGGGGGGWRWPRHRSRFLALEVLQCVSHLFRCVGPAGQSDIHVLFEETSARLRWSAVGSATHEIYEKAQEDQDQEDSLVEASHSWVVLGRADVTMLVKQLIFNRSASSEPSRR